MSGNKGARGSNKARPGIVPISIIADGIGQRSSPSRAASSVRSPGLRGDEEDDDGSRSRSPSVRSRGSQRIPNVRRLADITKTAAPPSPRSDSSQVGKGKRKPLKVKDCLKQMIKFVEKNDLKRILGENLTKKQLRQQLLPQARIAAKLPINLNYVNRELVMNLAVLSLYDLAVLIDDSVSMEFEEAGKRKVAVKHVLEIIAEVYGAVSEKKRGIRAIRFLNGSDDLQADNIQTREQIDELIDNHVFEGLTRIGTSLMQKILKPFIFDETVKWDKASKQPRKLRKLERPLLIMVITDGAVEGEPPSRLRQAIQSVVDSMKEAGFDLDIAKAIVFQFARVGNDRAAQRFLEHLDNKSQVKDYVDTLWGEDLMGVLANEEHQQRMMKLLLGPISSIYDEMESKKVSTGPDGYDSADDFDDDEENDEDFEDFDDDDDEEDDDDYDGYDDDDDDDVENGGGDDADDSNVNQKKANQRQGNQGRVNQRHSTGINNGDDGFDDGIDD